MPSNPQGPFSNGLLFHGSISPSLAGTKCWVPSLGYQRRQSTDGWDTGRAARKGVAGWGQGAACHTGQFKGKRGGRDQSPSFRDFGLSLPNSFHIPRSNNLTASFYTCMNLSSVFLQHAKVITSHPSREPLR